MKTYNVILSSFVALSLVMGSATVGFNKTVVEASGSNVSLAIESQEDVYGLQFEIKYNTDEISLNNISSKVDGFTFEYREKEDGLVKGLLFSMQGIAISNSNDISELLEFDFDVKNNFSGSSTVEFVDLILAGEHGSSIEVSASSFEVNTSATLPVETDLGKNYPNPFNPTTSFELNVGNAGHVTMNVYNVMGQVVETLVNNTMDAGSYNIAWDATNFSSGMYVVKAETATGLASQKVMLVK